MFSSEKCGAICFLSLCIVGSLVISQIGYGFGEGFHDGSDKQPDKQPDKKHLKQTDKK